MYSSESTFVPKKPVESKFDEPDPDTPNPFDDPYPEPKFAEPKEELPFFLQTSFNYTAAGSSPADIPEKVPSQSSSRLQFHMDGSDTIVVSASSSDVPKGLAPSLSDDAFSFEKEYDLFPLERRPLGFNSSSS